MDRILHIAVDVLECFYLRSADRHGFNDYALATAKRIQQFALSPQVTTLWVMMTAQDLTDAQNPFQLLPFRSPDDIKKLKLWPHENLFHVQPRVGDYLLNKMDGSAFNNPLLLPFIQEQGFSKIAISGSFIYGCSGGTFWDACEQLPAIPTTMLIDLVSTTSPILHNGELNLLSAEAAASGLGGAFMTSVEFLTSTKEKPAPPSKATPVSQLTKLKT